MLLPCTSAGGHRVQCAACGMRALWGSSENPLARENKVREECCHEHMSNPCEEALAVTRWPCHYLKRRVGGPFAAAQHNHDCEASQTPDAAPTPWPAK